MSESFLRFSPSPVQDTGSYRLLELPPELAKVLESSEGNATERFVLISRLDSLDSHIRSFV